MDSRSITSFDTSSATEIPLKNFGYAEPQCITRESPIPRWRRVSSVAILSLLSLFTMFDRYVTAGILPRLEGYYAISNTWGGLIQTAYVVVYVVCLIVIGAIGDRMSRKRIILVATFFWIIFMIISSFIPSNMFWLFIIIRSLTSIGIASVTALSPSLFADYFTGAGRAVCLMIFYMTLPVGSSSSIAFGSSLAQTDYFLWALRLCPIIAIIILIFSVFFLEEPLRGGLEASSVNTSGSVVHNLLSIVKVKSFWLSCLPTLLFNFYMCAFSWWSATLINSAMNSSNYDPAIYHGIPFGGWMGISSAAACVSGILGSIICVNFARLWREGRLCFSASVRAPAFTVGIGCVLSAPCVFGYLLLIDKEMFSAIAICSLGTVFAGGIYPLDVEIVLTVIPSSRRAAALSIMNILMCITGDGPAPFIAGLISDCFLGGGTSSTDQFEALRKGYSIVATIFACLSNSVLIYVIISTNINQVGPYRWLLLAFAIIDVLISLVHFSLMPAVHITEFGYIFWSYRVLNLPTEQAVWIMMIWVLLFYQTFVLTAFHYVYRFVMLCNPPWLSWIQRNPWRNWIAIAVIADSCYVGAIIFDVFKGFYPIDLFRAQFAPVMKGEYRIDLYAPNHPGFFGIVYWARTRGPHETKEWVTASLITIFALTLVFSTSGAVIVYCLFRILKEFAPSGDHLKSATRHMQKQLFRALLWQTIIPAFTSYLPVSFVFVAPLVTGISFGGVGTIMIMSTQIFPMLDLFLVIFFVRGMRASHSLLLMFLTAIALLGAAFPQRQSPYNAPSVEVDSRNIRASNLSISNLTENDNAFALNKTNGIEERQKTQAEDPAAAMSAETVFNIIERVVVVVKHARIRRTRGVATTVFDIIRAITDTVRNIKMDSENAYKIKAYRYVGYAAVSFSSLAVLSLAIFTNNVYTDVLSMKSLPSHNRTARQSGYDLPVDNAPQVHEEPACDGCCTPGPAGPQGAPGRPGHPGAHGAPGSAGNPGRPPATPCEPLTPPPCPQCPAGAPGLPGTPGEAGNDGTPGAPGSKGPDGENGEDGNKGRDGRPGAPGKRGDNGAPGKNADKGESIPGPNGHPGAPGPQGRVGPAGPPGKNGAPGHDGEKGQPGNNGAPGKDGEHGEPGFPGQEGTEGEKGICPKYCALDGGIFFEDGSRR
ncbi:hypothetical protein PRIPAC_83060 [Pristionchus pacificus]|uniref:G protein-coupled receptor n=1 Tax=Pristionchus pacificus TaxID=54126 RepID=A0A2A6CPC0_PRIPA|nr:hypothetical protein PRIPAC_83060 [Pristionchus pacificus]|eukprot:PDM80065.1 G protein-coupled receptor [Pristionchus pacificus]